MLRTAVVAPWLVAAAMAAWSSQPALAQNPLPAPPTAQQPPLGPPNSTTPPPEKIEPRVDPPGHSGTVRPPNVDPGMTVQPPANAQGTMPVVPPPGSRGGDQNVVPK
jgi:hypothetical protein